MYHNNLYLVIAVIVEVLENSKLRDLLVHFNEHIFNEDFSDCFSVIVFIHIFGWRFLNISFSFSEKHRTLFRILKGFDLMERNSHLKRYGKSEFKFFTKLGFLLSAKLALHLNSVQLL